MLNKNLKLDEETSLVYGILLGDGCLSQGEKYRSIVITCDANSDKPLFKKLVPILENLRKNKVKWRERKESNTIEINFSDKNLFNKYKSLGFPVGKKGKLGLPNFDKESLKNVIKGYFATDGCLVITNNNGIKYPRLEFSSISKKLLIQIKEFLQSFGIKGNVYLSKTYTNNWNNLYRLQINGKNKLFLFREKIGFFNPKHEKRLEQFL